MLSFLFDTYIDPLRVHVFITIESLNHQFPYHCRHRLRQRLRQRLRHQDLVIHRQRLSH